MLTCDGRWRQGGECCGQPNCLTPRPSRKLLCCLTVHFSINRQPCGRFAGRRRRRKRRRRRRLTLPVSCRRRSRPITFASVTVMQCQNSKEWGNPLAALLAIGFVARSVGWIIADHTVCCYPAVVSIRQGFGMSFSQGPPARDLLLNIVHFLLIFFFFSILRATFHAY